MAAEAGGIASKLGSNFERRFAVEQLLRMVAGHLCRLRWEPASGDTGGADIELERADTVLEHVQLKRQNRSDAEWSVAALDREGVLSAAARLISSHPTSRFVFVSSDSVRHLKDICDQATRNSDPPGRFVELRVRSSEPRHTVFKELLRRWHLNAESPADVEIAVARLRAMRFVLLDRGDDGEERLLLDTQQMLTGDPKNTVALLAAFLEERLGRDVLQQDVFEYLRLKGIHPRDLSRDPSLPSILHSLREEFRAMLRDRLVARTWLDRPQVTDAIERLTSSAPPRVLLVHGRPGAGKSAVLLGILEGLIERGVPVLPLSLSTRPPDGSVHQYGQALGLHASPVAALRATASAKRAVLLVDQLDALRLTTSAAAATWQICTQMLRAAFADPNTMLVVACRTFDLENDANIRRWKEDIERTHQGGVSTVEVANLTSADVEPVLRSVRVEYSVLPPKLQRLLLHPNTLSAWYQLVTRGSGRRDFATQTQLLSELIATLRFEASRDHHAPDVDVQMVLERAREQMETRGRLTVPVSLFDDRPTALQACCSVGLLVRSGGAVSFPHQSYFDHLVARAALRTSGHSAADILDWIKRDQSLQRRDQLRQLLFVLRDEDPLMAANAIELLLNDSQVRFHLKQLVFGVLREAEPVTLHEVDMIVRLLSSAEWAEHVRARLLWRSTAWFDALHFRGVWTAFLSTPEVEARRGWMSVVCSVMELRPDAVDDLLTPILAEPGGVDMLAHVLPYDPAEDSPGVAAVRDAQIRLGVWDVHNVMLNKVAKHDPKRAMRLLELTIRGAFRRGLAAGASGDRFERLHERVSEKHILRAARAEAPRSFKVFSRLLRACERLGIRAQRKVESLDGLAAASFRVSSILTSIMETLTEVIAESVAGLAECDLGAFQGVIERQQVRHSRALLIAVALGLQRAPAQTADAALKWLCAEPSRLALGEPYTRDAHGLAADIIRHHAPHCSAGTLRAVESLLLTYFPASEKEHYRHMLELSPQFLAQGHPVGQAQHLLLTAIPEAMRSAAARDRILLWDRKFGGPSVEQPAVQSWAGWVGSPIPHDRLDRVSDRQWLDIVARRWNRRWKRLGPDSIAESSPEHFAKDFGQCAKSSPRRFLRLAIRFPSNTPSVYLAALWDALADKSTETSSCDPDEVNLLFERTIEAADRALLISACRAIETHPGVQWGDSTWRLLEVAAANEEPKADEYTVHTINGGMRQPDIESTSLNCVRGAAASALAALAWNDAVRAARVVPFARELAADPHPAVRLAAAYTALGIYTTDKDEGASLLLCLTSHEDERVLAGHHLNELVKYVRWSHPGRLHPLFERMVRSTDPKVAEAGAKWVTAEFFQRSGACSALYRECSSGSVPQRIGVAKTLGHLLGNDSVDAAAIEVELVRLFDDTDSNVRGAATNLFQRNGVFACASGPRLAAVYVSTAAFVDHAQSFIWHLAHEALDLTPYASAIFSASDRFASELAQQTRSIQHQLGLAGRELSALLLRLYDAASKTGDRAMQERCLDRWDGLLASRVGDAEAHLESIAGA